MKRRPHLLSQSSVMDIVATKIIAFVLLVPVALFILVLMLWMCIKYPFVRLWRANGPSGTAKSRRT